MPQTQKTYYVCPAPPCPNGNLHLGHISGVYLLADIYVRFQRISGHRAYYVTGSDENGTYTLAKANELGRPVDEVAQLHNQEIIACLRGMGIEPDEFVRTSSDDHTENSLSIYRNLKANGFIKVDEGQQLYCDSCSEFAADSLATGNCPACSAPTDSNLCENCGLAIHHAGLQHPRHALCSGPLTLRTIRQVYLDVEKLSSELHQAISDSKWPEAIKALELKWLRGSLRALPMSRYFDRGVVLPEPEDVAGQTLLTWFEGLWCFDTGIRRLCEREGIDYQQSMSSPDSRIVFFMGQDNRFYYTVGVTASLLARGYQIPFNQSIQDFSTLEGSKFSTSRDHVIWANEAAKVIDQNVLRFYLASIAKPFGTNDNKFELERLIAAAQKLHCLEVGLRNYADRAEKITPSALGSILVKRVDAYVLAMDELAFWEALSEIDGFVCDSGIYNGSTEWNVSEVETLLRMLAPFIPLWAKRYGELYFGLGWAPSMGAVSQLPQSLPLPEAHFELTDGQIPERFISDYKQQFRAVTTA